MERSDIWHRSRLLTLLLCFFFGIFGAHRFYVGKIGTALLMALTLGGLGIWYLIDLLLIAVGSFRDIEGRAVYQWLESGARPDVPARVQDMNVRIDRIDAQLTQLQGTMIELDDKFDRQQYGHLL
jgi:hypothetical protein